MFRLSLGRTLAVAAVVSLILATPWCMAATRKSPSSSAAGGISRSTRPEIAHHRWGWLTRVWAKVGCTIDPSGHGHFGCDALLLADPGTYSSEGEVGCTIDPSGTSCGDQ